MSVEAMAWALTTPLSGTKKILLIGLANHATAEFDSARPAISTLATYTSIHERNVQRALRELEVDGWIECTGEHPVRGRRDRAVRVYRLCPERGGAAATALPDGVALASERGGAGVPNGVALAPPEPSVNRPREPSLDESAGARDPIGEVWEHYQTTRSAHPGFSRCLKFGSEERKLIKAALEVADADECKLAITGLFRSDYHVAGGYVHLKYALRGGGHSPSPLMAIDRLASLARNGGNGNGGRAVGILERQTWPDGRSWQELTRAEQENAKEAMAMGGRPWEAPAPVVVHMNGNGNGVVSAATMLAED